VFQRSAKAGAEMAVLLAMVRGQEALHENRMRVAIIIRPDDLIEQGRR
jgi:hypothetical protein